MLFIDLLVISLHRTFMSKLIFRMRDVPIDEADEVRALLDSKNIDYFETFGGNWGISMPALWVKDPAKFKEARTLIDQYQKQRLFSLNLDTSEESKVKTLLESFKDRPVQFVAYWFLIAIVLFISIYYFFSL
jgi:hypothetical protein